MLASDERNPSNPTPASDVTFVLGFGVAWGFSPTKHRPNTEGVLAPEKRRNGQKGTTNMQYIDEIPVWGDHEPNTLEQAKVCARTADYFALMADGHPKVPIDPGAY